MINNLLLFLAILIAINYSSSYITTHFFHLLSRQFKNKKIIIYIIAFLYFPGTVFHEMSHLFTAMILMLNVTDINLFPQFTKYKNYIEIKMGFVRYEKKDFIRGFIVGIAPFFWSLSFFFLIYKTNIFPNSNFYINATITYLIFTISSSMFPSKADLKDQLPFFLLLIMIGLLIYIFNLNLLPFLNQFLIDINSIAYDLNKYLSVSLFINIILVIIFKISFKKIK